MTHLHSAQAGEAGEQSLVQLNDTLRCHGQGGITQLSRGVRHLSDDLLQHVLQTVAKFDAFTPDNDPYGEHDCARIDVAGTAILWKIDYYDKHLAAGSPDPADPECTTRVLTIMLAEEY